MINYNKQGFEKLYELVGGITMKLNKNKALASVMSLVMAGGSFLPGVKAECSIKDKVTNFAKTNLTPAIACCFGAMGVTAAVISIVFGIVNSESKENDIKKLRESINNLYKDKLNNKDNETKCYEEIVKDLEKVKKIIGTKDSSKIDVETVMDELIKIKLNEKLEKVWAGLVSDRTTKFFGSSSYKFTTSGPCYNNKNSNVEFILRKIYVKLLCKTECLDLIKNYGNKNSDLYSIANVVSDNGGTISVTLSRNIFSEIDECMKNLKGVYKNCNVELFVNNFFDQKLEDLNKQLVEKEKEANK